MHSHCIGKTRRRTDRGNKHPEDALARLRLVTGRYVETGESVNRAVAASPEDPRGYELQGELAHETGNFAGARLAYQKTKRWRAAASSTVQGADDPAGAPQISGRP